MKHISEYLASQASPRLNDNTTPPTWIQRIEAWRQEPCPHCGETIPEDRRPFLCDCEGAREERARRDAELQTKRESLIQDHVRRRREGAGLLGILQEMTFESFDETLQPEAYEKAKGFTGKDGECLILYGHAFGVGKTHLCAAILNRWINEGHTGLFCEVPTLLRRLRATFSPDARESEQRIFQEIQGAGLLVLDDLGRERWSTWVEETLYQIINHRYLRMMPVVATTNLLPSELAEAVGLAILSRLSERGIFVCMEGADYRLKGRG